MFHINKSLASLISAVCLTISFSSQATVITSGCVGATSCTLEELFSGGSIGVDDVTFENWVSTVNTTLEEDFNTGAITNGTVDTSAITVSAIDAMATGTPNEFTLGLSFSTSSAWSILDVIGDFLSVIEQQFSYDATTIDDTTITAAEITLGDRFVEDFDSLVEVGLDSSLFTGPLDTFERYFEFDAPQRSEVESDSTSLAGVTSLDLISIIDLEVDSFDEPGHLFQQDVDLDSFILMLTVQTTPTPPPTPANAPAALPILLSALTVMFYRRRKQG